MNKEIADFIRKCLIKKIINKKQTAEMISMLEIEERSKDIWKWGKYYFGHKFTDEFCEELHGYLFDIRHEEITSTLAPRGHGKTIISCFLIPIYLALHSDKYKYFFNVQNTATKAIAVNTSIKKEFESNELLRRDYGDMISDKWSEKCFILSNGIIFSAAGAGESIRGINVNNIRPDYLIIDDLYVEDDINQPARIKKANDWFKSTLYPTKSGTKKCAIHIQGTAIDKLDIMHEFGAKENVKYKVFQAITDEGTPEQDTLWFEYEDLMDDKEIMGSIIFMREFQNELRSDENSIIKERWIHYYNGKIPQAEKIKYIIGGIDPAIGVKQTNDCTGKVACIVTENWNYYIVDARNERLAFEENITDIKSFHEKHKFKTLRIECISAFKVFAQRLRTKTRIPVAEITHVKDKITRLVNCQHFFENGKVFINENMEPKVLQELVHQLINNHPKHDDLRDALILCLEEKKSSSVAGMFS